MSAPFIFRFVGDSLSNLTDHYVTSASAGLAGALGPVALVGVTLFITIYGVLVVAGKIQQPFQDFLLKAGKIAIIAAIALNAGNYMSWVVSSIQGLESGLIAAMSGGGNLDTSSTYALLDSSIGNAADKAALAMEKVGEKRWYDVAGWAPWLITALLMYAGIVIFFLVGGAMVVMAKFALALMLAIGPLFIMALLWAPTAGFFDRWLAQTLTYVFTIVLLAAVLSMAITIFNHLITNTVYDDESNVLFIGVQILFISGILAFIIMQIGGMASGIAGGAGMAALSLRQLTGAVTSPAKAIAGRVNPVSNRLDPTTGLQTSSSRFEHMAMGRSVFAPNPAYRNALQERLRSTFNRGGNSVQRGR